MPAGLLEVRGTIDVSQFWPSGRSDADTATVVLTPAGDPIKFRKNDAAPLRATHVFNDVFVQGRQGRKEAIKNGHVTIRFQGIDAAELHFQPTALSRTEQEDLSQEKKQAFHKVNHPYRQFLGATSAKGLHDFLATVGTTFDCRVFTEVDKPSEVFDTYGRLIGDIEIAKNHSMVNLNHWLIEQGWAFPTYYSSMTNEEITAIDALAKTAQSKERGVWKFLSKTVGTFDFDLREPKKNDLSVLANDRGPVLFPKLYRRFTSWSARHKAQVTDMSFQKFLEGGVAGKPDDCFEIKDFLANGVHSATRHTFDRFVQSGKTIHFEPGGLVFSEAPSRLVRNGSDVPDQF